MNPRRIVVGSGVSVLIHGNDWVTFRVNQSVAFLDEHKNYCVTANAAQSRVFLAELTRSMQDRTYHQE